LEASDTTLRKGARPLEHSRAQSGIEYTTNSINKRNTRKIVGRMICQNEDILNSFDRVSFVVILFQNIISRL